MVIEYVAVRSGAVLDVLTGNAVPELVYATGKARPVVDQITRTLRPDRQMDALRSWSNGYVLTRERAG